MRFYDAEELSSNRISCLCQDKQGYIWIGTEYGLNKFDGVHFTQYYNNDSDPHSLADDIIRSLMTAGDGGLWVVSNRGVQRYSREADAFETVRFVEKRSEAGSETADINAIVETPDGDILVLSASDGVYQIDVATLVARPLDAINKHIDRTSKCERMYADARGRLWVAYGDKGLQMIDMRRGVGRYYDLGLLGGGRAIDVIEDGHHRLTVLTYTALLQLNEQTQTFVPALTFPRSITSKLYKNDHGQLFVATQDNGIWRVDLERQQLRGWSQGSTEARSQGVKELRKVDLEHEYVRAFLEDRGGNHWIGCHQRGLFFASNRQHPFHFLALEQTEHNNGGVLRQVYADGAGHIYVCQEKGGITDIDHEGRTLRHWLGGQTVMTIHEDSENMFWAGTLSNGLFRIDPRTGREELIPLTTGQRIGSITQDQQGNLYTAVFNDGLHSYTPDGKTERTLGKGKLNLNNPYLNKLYTDRDGRIWIGHYYGIDVYDPKTDKLVDVNVPEKLRPAIVYAIDQSADGSIWIGSNKGLFQYQTQGDKKGQWKRFTTKEGLPNDIICGFVITADGTIWVSTFRGLAKIETNGHITRYYRGNGLQEWSYQRGAYAQTAIGEIILGNQNGITYFVPDSIVKDDFHEGITLTGMRLAGTDVNTSTLSGGKHIITVALDMTDDITVSYNDNTFSLRFSPMDFRDAQNMHYEYRFRDEPRGVWHQTRSGVSEIFFSHLSVGNHVLLVRAYDNGVYSPVKKLSLHVSPPWYRTWGAYAFLLILFLAIAALWWRNYWNRRQAEANEEKIKFFVDISHELRSPLTLIKTPLEELLRNNHDPAQTRALRNIERNTNRLLTLTNQILSLRKIEKGQMRLHFAQTALASFVSDIIHDYEYQVEKRHLTLTFDNQAPDITVWIDRDNFDKVITNLLNNAIKYVQDGGEVSVVVSRNAEGQAELTVRDNGPGINETQLRKIFERFYQSSARPAAGQISYGIGLNLTQKLVSLHHGTITARNRTDGKGSEFIVRLPLGSQHLPQDQLVDDNYYASSSTTTTRLQQGAFYKEQSSDAPLRETSSAALGEASSSLHEAASSKTTLTIQRETPRRLRKKTTYRIAVVDDDEEIRNFLQTELGETYHIQTYPDGQKALEGIVDSVPDLVVSDVVMPQLDGFQLLKRLKASTTTSHIPVILLTTKTEHQARVHGLEHGADAYVDKPFNLKELEAQIASLIANRLRMRGKFTGLQEQENTVRKVELKGNDAALMERIMKAVNQRLNDSDFNVEALADEIGLSRVQLHRRMKELTGISVGEFIRNLRLQQAAKLLAAGDTTVSQVTYAVGFANPTHFTATFKKHFGVTPSEYMAKCQREREQGNKNDEQ